MAYKVGISSGWWNIGKDPALMGLAQKAGSFGATAGVQFNQVDLDTILEFLEPDLERKFKRTVKELGIEVGLHAEIGEMIALESAQRRFWERAHERLCTTLRYAAQLGFIYVNIHASQLTGETLRLDEMESRLRAFGHQYQVVAPDGNSFPVFVQKDKDAYEAFETYIDPRSSVDDRIRDTEQDKTVEKIQEKHQKELDDFVKEIKPQIEKEIEEDPESKNLTPEQKNGYVKKLLERERAKKSQELNNRTRYDVEKEMTKYEKLLEMSRKSPIEQYFMRAGEIGAYLVVAHSMQKNGDSLWRNIVKETSISAEDTYNKDQFGFNGAVAARYVEGHLRIKNHQYNKELLNGMSAIEWCEKNKIQLLIESPHTSGGQEGLTRLYHPRLMYELCKKISSPYFNMTIDFEQTMANKIDLDKLIPTLPNDFGARVFLFHLGDPVPYFGTAHIPIAIGSHGQEVLYTWLYAMKQKGFKNGYIIFERGGGRSGGGKTMAEVFEHSVLALRQMVKYLDKDLRPKDLPPEFFGISYQNEDVFARQVVAVRDHYMDPMEGLLMIPEEKHGFLSKSSVEKGKGQEWEKRKYR